MSGEDDTTLPGVPGPVKDPYSGLHEESIYALWQDPTQYDHVKHGPPYLPESKGRMATASTSDRKTVKDTARPLVQKMAADEMTEIVAVLDHIRSDFGPTPMSEMASLLAFIRAEAVVHQAHHWQTRGDYGDHLLFDRIYNGVFGEIDKVAERMIGSGHHILAHPILLAKHCSMVVQSLYRDAGENPSSDAYPVLSLRATLRTLVALKLVYSALEAKNQLSHGIDNLLQGIADEHEGHVYLLKQRIQAKTASSYDRRDTTNTSHWKAE
jgi:DNA-binding ferritin-like protein